MLHYNASLQTAAGDETAAGEETAVIEVGYTVYAGIVIDSLQRVEYKVDDIGKKTGC